ncbi:MAG: response regulator [Elusimicrobia bacterium]|nr:response regulator [Elusimicrobiota bacterium]
MKKTDLLIIDDDPDWMKFAVRFFSSAGYGVQTASDGAEGLGMARRRRPGAILLDFHMDGADGGKVCAAIRADAGLRKIPIIMVTVDPGEEENAYFEYKADAFVFKGDKLTKVQGIVEAVLRRVGWERGTLEKGDIRLEPEGCRVFRRSKLLASLSREQFRLLSLLLERSPAFVTEEEIARRLFNSDCAPEKEDAIRGLVYRLRVSLGRGLGRRIKNKSSRGWIYVQPRPEKRNSAPAPPK